jgi:hypothetical protein
MCSRTSCSICSLRLSVVFLMRAPSHDTITRSTRVLNGYLRATSS